MDLSDSMHPDDFEVNVPNGVVDYLRAPYGGNRLNTTDRAKIWKILCRKDNNKNRYNCRHHHHLHPVSLNTVLG